MTRHVTAAVAVVALLTLAGCSALPMWDDGDATPTPTPETPTDGGVPTADPGGEGGAGPEADYPDGYGPSGVEDAEAATNSHVESLVDTDGYIFTYDALVREDGGETALGIVSQADNVDGVGYTVQNRPDAAVAAYFEDDRVYLREESGGETRYNASDFEYSMSRFTGYQYVGPLLDHVEYGDAEVVETEEGTYYHYVSDEVNNPGAVLRNDVDEERIERFDVAIVVDERGVVRQAGFVVEADRNVSVSMDVGEIGSTNVERPEWFDEANNA